MSNGHQSIVFLLQVNALLFYTGLFVSQGQLLTQFLPGCTCHL